MINPKMLDNLKDDMRCLNAAIERLEGEYIAEPTVANFNRVYRALIEKEITANKLKAINANQRN